MPQPTEQPTTCGTPDPALVTRLLSRIDSATPFLTVSSTSGTSGTETIWVGEVISAARDGADPLRGWRTALQALQEQQTAGGASHGPEPADDTAGTRSARRERVPAHLPAAFVLQWWCEVIATPIAYAVELGPWVLVPEARALGFEIATGLYPNRIIVQPQHTTLTVQTDVTQRRSQARAAYDRLVEPVVRDFAPEVRMGSRQRWGLVDDVWTTAERAAAGATGRSVGPTPLRTSCCFIYLLPGLHECAACPRLGPPTSRP